MSQTEQKRPNVERFEQAVAAKNYENACNELLDILGQLDTDFGHIHNIEFQAPPALENENLHYQKVGHLATRVAVATTTLFCDPALYITDSGALRFFTLQRWLSFIFASSPYVNADHILRTYNIAPESEEIVLAEDPNKARFSLLPLTE